jgi:ribonuclease P protein component
MVEKSLHADGHGAVKSSAYQAKQGLSKEYAPAGGFAAFDMARLGSTRSLCKDERLSRELLLDKLFKEGKSISQSGFTLVYLQTVLPAFYPAQAGFSVPKRYFKRATDRNTIRRLLREAYRLNKLPLYQKLVDNKYQLALMLIYKGAIVPDHLIVGKNVTELLSKLITRLKTS